MPSRPACASALARPRLVGDVGQRDPAGEQVAAEAGDAADVVVRRPQDLDAAVGVVDPVDRHLVDAQPGALGEHEQLGVEEPRVVLDERQHLAGDVAADRLEAALRVGEPGAQRLADQDVVAAGDDLALGAARDPGPGAQPAADGEVGVAADQRRDQRHQRVEVGRQVDVHVDEDLGVRVGPHPLERAAAALLGQVHDADGVVAVRQPPGDDGGAVGAGVVGDGDPERPRHRREVRDDPLDRGGQRVPPRCRPG